ncbi:MAG: tetratricopeptide repeat protein [Acidobacteria bacterium]|nr:tetratricopeptide repeat protein [Acidobacteriota bacterium]
MSRSWRSLIDPPLDAAQPGGLLAQARRLNARGHNTEAAELLDRHLAENRADFDAWFERLLTLGDGMSEDAAQDMLMQLESVRDEHPEASAVHRNLGHLRLVLFDLDGAERSLLQALKLEGADARTLELMGLLCLNSDKPEEAKTWLLKALTLQPKDPHTLRLLALTLEAMDDLQGAEAQLSAALEADPEYFWGWHTLGEQLIRRSRFGDGLRCIAKARSLNSLEPASYFILAELMAEHGHLDIAQGQLHMLMLMAPEAHVLAEAQCLLGEYRRDLGDPEGATSYFTLAADTDPQAANPWAALGDMAREDSRVEDALRCYREALARDPEAADIQVQMGYVLLDGEQPQSAEQAFLQALESDPAEYSAYLGLSECYRLAGRTEDQALMVKEAMALAPDDADVWNAQGVALEVQGNLEAATESYDKALALDPSLRKAANNLGYVLEKRMEKGETALRERAVEAWKRRLLICRDEGQSLKKSTDHLKNLGVTEEQILRWVNHEATPTI